MPPAAEAPSTISDQLRAAIRGSGMSIRQISKLADLDDGMIYRFLAADRSITLEPTADKLAEVLGLVLMKPPEAIAKGRRRKARPEPEGTAKGRPGTEAASDDDEA